MKKTKNEKRRLLLNKRLGQNTIEKKRAKYARITDSKLFVKTNSAEAVRAPLNKRLIAIILTIVMVVGLIPAGFFIFKPKAEEFENLSPVEMQVTVNGIRRDPVQINPGVIATNITPITNSIENAPAKMVFEGAFLVDADSTPATETRISSVGTYNGDVYYALGEENDTGIKKTRNQNLVLVYSSEYDVTTHPGEGGRIEVDDTVPWGDDLHVTVTAPKGHSISNVTYTIGDASYTATLNSNGDFTIPGSQVVNDIDITSTYSQIETFTIKDARKVQNSKYYNLYGLEGHGGITATIGVSAEGQPYDSTILGGHDLYNDWSENKYQLFTSDAILVNGRWSGTYPTTSWGQTTQNPVYGAPSTNVYSQFNNISTGSNNVITDIQPNSVPNGEGTTFYLYSQSKSGDSNGWGLNMLSINGEEIPYPVGSTVGSYEEKDMKDGTHVTVTLISTDSPLYWNSGDVSYNYSGTSTRYFAKTEKATYTRSDVASLWYYNAPTANKHRYIYQVDIDHVQDNLEVAYNFKDVDQRKIILTGLEGIDETGAAYEWRGHGVSSTGSTSALIRLFESRDYYYTSASNPATTNGTDLNDWKQHEYDAFYFERYGGGATFVPSANVYTYRIKSGYNPYTVTAKAQYDSSGEWVEGEDLLAGPTDEVVGDLGNVIKKASENSNEQALEIIRNANIPEDWKDEDSALVDWVTNYLSFDSTYRFWGESPLLTNHGDVGTRDLRTPVYNSSTHNTPSSSNTNKKLFLNRIADYETILQNEEVKNYKFYGIALQQNEAKDQLLQLNAHPYQYTMVFDANGGEFPDTLQTGYSRLANNEFADSEFYTQKTNESIKQSNYYTMANGDATTHMPKRSMAPERKGYYFGGWELYKNGQAVTDDNYNNVYVSNQAFVIDENSIDYSEGNVKLDQNHTFTFKAKWIEVAPEADMATLSVSVYRQTGSDENKNPDYTNGTIIDHRTEPQIAGDTVLLNQHKPAFSDYYVLDEERSKIETTTSKGSDETNPDNQLEAYFKWRAADLTVTKRVTGNPKALKDGFEITILLTKDPDSPVDATAAVEMIKESNPDSITLTDVQRQGDNAVKVVGLFGRSNSIVLENVPYGWTATVSEPTAVIEGNNDPDYTTSISTHPEDFGTVDTSDTSKTSWTGRITKDATVTVTNESESYLILDKSISRNDAGTYDLKLEAFATGDVTTETIKEKTPTDFILVVDQSGSMAIRDMAKKDSYVSAGTKTLEEAATGNYYYTDNKGNTYRVYGKKGYLYRYYPANDDQLYVGSIVDDVGARLNWFMGNSEQEFNQENLFYIYDEGKYYPIHMTIKGALLTYYISFYYYKNGRQIWLNREDTTYTNGVNSPWYKNVFDGLGVIKPGWGVWPVNYSNIDGIVQGVYGRNNDERYTYSEVLSAHTGMYVNYDLFKRKIGYTGLYYRDAQGVEHVIPSTNDGQTTTGYCDDNGYARVDKPSNSGRMEYNNLQTVQSSGLTTRLEALQDALNQFADAVAAQSDDLHTKVDNRIAIVGFSGEGNSSNNNEILTNTGLAINADPSNGISAYSYTNESSIWSADDTNGYHYFPDGKNYIGTQSDYVNSLLRTADATQLSQIRDAIQAVTAYGGTQPETGLAKAESILQQREETTYQSVVGTRERNKVVVFFTDGEPGDYDYSHRLNEANEVISKAKELKDDNVTIFSVGVFGESDAEPLTYRAYRETTNTSNEALSHEYDLGYWKTYYGRDYDLSGYPYRYHYLNRYWMAEDAANYGATANDTIFDYMSVVSSNYPAAEKFWDNTWTTNSSESWLTMTQRVRDPYKNSTNEEYQDKKALTENKYYRSASSQEALIAAFLDIAEVEASDVTASSTGMSGTTAVLRDVINSDDFVIDPEHPPVVTAYTLKGRQTQNPGDDASAFIDFDDDIEANRQSLSNPSIEWSEDGTYVDVGGFDYGANFIAYGKPANAKEETAQHEGKKLVVTISGLKPKQNATGELKSNTDDSGIYKLVAGETEGEMKAQQMDAFISPTMQRYAYTVTEPHVYTEDTFAVTMDRSADGSSILVTYDEDGGREEHLVDPQDGDSFIWNGVKDGDTIYWELLNNSYNDETPETLNATISKDGLNEVMYTYHLDRIDTTDGTVAQTSWNSVPLKQENTTLQVTNVSNLRDVTIVEETRGVAGEADYSDKEHQFPIHIQLLDQNGQPVNTIIEGATITRKKTGETDQIDELRFGNDGWLNTDVKLANGDKIEFEVLNGYTVVVLERDSDAGEYDVTYEPDNDTDEEGTAWEIGDTNHIKVVNTLHENPDISSGILDSNNPFGIILAVLALICGFVAGGTVFYSKRKKIK